MIRRRRAGPVPESMLDRYRQVYRAGEVTLHPFTRAELDAVTLDAEALPAAERGPFAQAATPLLTGQGAQADYTAEAQGSAVAQTGPEMEESAAAARATAAASLERHGFLRPGPPDHATGRAPDELAAAAGRPHVCGRAGTARRGDAKKGRDGHGMKGETERAHGPWLSANTGSPVRSQP